MPVYIQNMTSDVTVSDVDMPLNERQLRQIVDLVARRVQEMLREEQLRREMNGLRHRAASGDQIDE